jgi:hypothetical protein
MHATLQPAPASNQRLWAGRILSGLAVLFMLADAVMHILQPQPVIDAFHRLGYPVSLAVPLGVIVIVCVALYAVPRTSFLGALFLTGYLGGAVSSHVRIGDVPFNIAFPFIVASLIWAGLFLRDRRLPALFRVPK